MAEVAAPASPAPKWKLPCISLWRPWADWVGLTWKQVETRTHRRFASLEGKTIGIHVAGKWDNTAIDAARKWLSREQIAATESIRKDETLCGCIRWLAKVTRHGGPLLASTEDESRALIECGSVERYGLFLADVRPLPICDHTRVRGRQGIFYVELPRQLVFPDPK